MAPISATAGTAPGTSEPVPDGTHLHSVELAINLLYPDHAKRTESAEHQAVRHELITQRKFGCWICGRNVDDFGGDDSQLEIHHLFAEYSEFLNIDPARVAHLHPIFAPYNKEGTYTQVDDKVGSLVICALHHRGAKTPGRVLEEGIHYADLSTWMMQAFVADDKLHLYFPGVILIRKGVSDENGYLTSFLASHPKLAAELPLPHAQPLLRQKSARSRAPRRDLHPAS